MSWQPIETAPKDRAILVAWEPPRRDSDWFTPWLVAWAKWEEEDAEFQMLNRQSWGEGFPTHWQPLPEPPQEETK